MPTDAPVGCATVLDRALPPFATGTVLAGLGYSAAAGIALAGGWPLAVVLAAAPTAYIARRVQKLRTLRRVAKVIDCDGRLAKPLRVVPGYVASAYTLRAGVPPAAVRELEFRPAGGELVAHSLTWEHARGYEVLAIGSSVYAWLPAYQVLDSCCAYVARLGPELVPQRGPVRLKAESPDGDYAEAAAEVRGSSLCAQVQFAPVRARSARVDLYVRGAYALTVISTSGGTAEACVDVAGRPGIYVFREPISSARPFGLNDYGVLGLGAAGYAVRLVIDMPRRRDYYTEAEI